MNEPQINKTKICDLGKQVLKIEADAVNKLIDRIDTNFADACIHLLNCNGRIIVTGMGKSGHIANKIAATLASTGSPAFYIHPAEASHGDFGMITKKDIMLIISNSGNTPEIIALMPLIKHLELTTIAITGNPKSNIAKQTTIHLDTSIEKEACPLGLAPTASTTAALAMGDAIAIALLETRGFSKNDFALSHPGGSLGIRLLLKIDELMRTDDAIPKVSIDADLSSCLIEMSSKRLGMTTIVDSDDKLIGIYTDGDLRRSLDKNIDIHKTKIADVMSTNSKTISIGTLAYEALRIMEEHEITSLVILDENDKVIGVVHLHDILKAGVM